MRGPRSIFSFGGGGGGGWGGLKLMGAGGVLTFEAKIIGASLLKGFGGMPPRKILTDMSSKMAKNASKYVRRNA